MEYTYASGLSGGGNAMSDKLFWLIMILGICVLISGALIYNEVLESPYEKCIDMCDWGLTGDYDLRLCIDSCVKVKCGESEVQEGSQRRISNE